MKKITLIIVILLSTTACSSKPPPPPEPYGDFIPVNPDNIHISTLAL